MATASHDETVEEELVDLLSCHRSVSYLNIWGTTLIYTIYIYTHIYIHKCFCEFDTEVDQSTYTYN